MTQRLHAPIGLDLGGETPGSIALSAIAEIEAVMHARPGGFLRERHTPIHTRTPTPRLLSDAPLAARERVTPTVCATNPSAPAAD